MGTADQVYGARPANQLERGGSIPTDRLFFESGRDDEAKSLVLRFHYSQRWPANVQFVGTLHKPGGLFGDCGDAVAACVFSIPPTRWSEPVLELSRLVRTESERPALSRLVSLCCIYLKKRVGFDLLVSFADKTHNHHGGIYQACSWNYGGLRERQMDGVNINGEFRPGRSCNSAYGTRSPDKLAEILDEGNTIDPHYDEGKYLYWRALNASGIARAKRLGLKTSRYPKPRQTL